MWINKPSPLWLSDGLALAALVIRQTLQTLQFRHSSSLREAAGENDKHLWERKNLPAKCYTIKTCNILLAWSYDLAGGEKASETVDDLYKFNCGDPSICHLLFVIVIVFVFDINYCVDRLFVICIGHCILYVWYKLLWWPFFLCGNVSPPQS